MAKVNILTIVNEPNYGACLQGYALYKTLQNMGHQPRVINLLIDYRSRPYTLLNKILISAKNFIKGYAGCYAKARKFTNEFMPFQTPTFHNIEELRNYDWDENEYYIVGSDQVWNPNITGMLSEAYILSFLPEKCRLRYSYASSFGVIKDEKELLSRLPINEFKRFKKISVREAFGVDFLRKHGIDSTEVVDPTLLLESYTHLLRRPVTTKQQMFFSVLSDTQEQQEFVNNLSAMVNLPIKKLYGYLQPSRKVNGNFAEVEEWLQNIAEAELVVTDSFHATVFAILFHRPFFVYLSQPGKGDRIYNLLNRLGISATRIIKSADDAKHAEAINYESVDAKIQELRQHSLNYLKSIFTEE